MKKINVPSIEPTGDRQHELLFPDKWDVARCDMDGVNKPVLGDDEIRTALENPIAAKPLSRLVQGHKEVVVLFDDSTRPTKTFRVLPFVLDALKKERIPEDNIRFIVATGSHGPHGRLDFVRKLGEDIVEEYAVYNHNPYDNLKDLGKTSRGTPVKINAEVMGCDLKIGIGSIHFHRLMGFTGGAR